MRGDGPLSPLNNLFMEIYMHTLQKFVVFFLLLPAIYAASRAAAAAEAPSADSSAAVSAVPVTETVTAPDTAVPARLADGKRNSDIVVLKENLDTVFIFDKSVFRHVARDWRNNIDIFRQRGYGASGSVYYGANAILIKPVRELAENLPALADRQFSFGKFGFEPFLMSGGAGYVGLGDGFRLGGAGMRGERRFSSAPFNGDSVLVLNTNVSYGGFLIEKCVLRGKWNLSAGGLIGGGSIKVAITEKTSTFFYGEDDDFTDTDYQYNHQAAFFMVEPHCGFTYTFFYFFHFGARLSCPTFMSLDKFGIYTNDFFSVNPGIRINLTFGNIG
jgi:hypothetical protein